MRAYYNEHDPFAASWLRELITAGLIADGEVDERSIADVQPDELRGFTQCHFFAGIGGWSYALRLAGWDDTRPVWTGSCPCQPFSSAGKQVGGGDDRHLWPYWARLIAECRPVTVFGEQVESAVAHGWLDAVFDDLEREGYACGAASLPAASVGAFHLRQRVWFVADRLDHAASARRQRSVEGAEGQARDEARLRVSGAGGGSSLVADRDGSRFGAGRTGETSDGRDATWEQSSGLCAAGYSTDGITETATSWTKSVQRECITGRGAASADGSTGELGGMAESLHAKRRKVDGHRENERDGQDAGRAEAHGQPGARGEVRDVADASRERRTWERLLLRAEEGRRDTSEVPETAGRGESGDVEITEGNRGDGALQPSQRQAVSGPMDASTIGGFWSDVEWIACRDGKARPVEPSIFPLASGVPNRVGLLRGAGNAIVPQVAAEFIAAYIETANG